MRLRVQRLDQAFRPDGFEVVVIDSLPGEEFKEFREGVWVSSEGRVFGRDCCWSMRYPAFAVDGQNYSVHRVVAELFVPNPRGFPVVRHLNDDKNDCRAKNLAWGTARQNHRDGVRNGIFKVTLSNALVRAIRDLRREGRSYAHIGRCLGIHQDVVSEASIGKTWGALRGCPPVAASRSCVRYSLPEQVAIARKVRELGSARAAARVFSCSPITARKYERRHPE